jgi:hypothetical protein
MKLFDCEGGTVKPTEHCYTISWLRNIMDKYPDNYLKVYAYLFYMTSPNPKLNPYADVAEDEKEELILKDIEANFSTEDDAIVMAKLGCEKLFETPTARAYKGISTMLDRLSVYMSTTQISHGRDGNINSLVAAAKNFAAIRDSFKKVREDLEKETNTTRARGGVDLAYDQ